MKGLGGSAVGMRVVALVLVFALVLGGGLPAGAQSFWDELLAGFESSIGAAVAQDVEEEYGPPVSLPTARQRWVDTIFADIVLQAERRDITYTLSVLDSDVVNAFAAPGGYIFLTTALLGHIGDDTDALANVIGHEIAHVEHKHGMNALGRNLGLSLLLELAFGNPSEGDEVWHVVAGVAVGLMQLGWSRDQEHDSDALGQRLAADAGYDPEGMVRFFQLLQRLEGEEVPFLEFLSTHPLTSERVTRAQNRAETLTVQPRTVPKPSVSGGRSSSLQDDFAREEPTDESVAQLDRPDAPGLLYEDPAKRFSLWIPPHFRPEPNLFLNITRFDGPEHASLWVFVEQPRDGDNTVLQAVERTVEFYRELFPDLRLEDEPRAAKLGDAPAQYVEYRYTNDAGIVVREGGYFALRDGLLYMVQFAEPAFRFAGRQGDYEAMAASFTIGQGGYGSVDPTALATSPERSLTMAGLFTMNVSELWPLTWERPRTRTSTESPQVAEFLEIGEQGYMAMFEYRAGFTTTSMDTARDWLRFVQESQRDVEVLEPIRRRRIGNYDGASFLVSWSEGGVRWTQYSTTVVVNLVSYEIGIAYRADGFGARREIFDRWLDSWRLSGRD